MTTNPDALDSRSRKSIATLDPRCREAFTRFTLEVKAVAMEYGCDYVMISGNRTYAEQDALYQRGRFGNAGPKVTNAKGGFSSHNFGIAADYGVFRHGAYLDEDEPALAERVHRACAARAEGWGLTWGGHWESFPDFSHYEVALPLTLRQKRERYEAKGSLL